MKTKKSPYEQALEASKAGTLQTPDVSAETGKVDYFLYQFATHHFHLKIMAKGMKFKHHNLKTFQTYYGLKGKTFKDCMAEFEIIFNAYKESLKAPEIKA